MILRMVGGPWDGTEIRAERPVVSYVFASAPVSWNHRTAAVLVEGRKLSDEPIYERQHYRFLALVEGDAVRPAIVLYTYDALRVSGGPPRSWT